jgi:hypothetical protein
MTGGKALGAENDCQWIVTFLSGPPLIRLWRQRANRPGFARPGKQASDPLVVRAVCIKSVIAPWFAPPNIGNPGTHLPPRLHGGTSAAVRMELQAVAEIFPKSSA